jgi:hypothetical protein
LVKKTTKLWEAYRMTGGYVTDTINICEISSSHGGEYEVQNCLLGCTAVYNNCRPTFLRYVLPPSTGMISKDNSELQNKYSVK